MENQFWKKFRSERIIAQLYGSSENSVIPAESQGKAEGFISETATRVH